MFRVRVSTVPLALDVGGALDFDRELVGLDPAELEVAAALEADRVEGARGDLARARRRTGRAR